jgi:Uma2 family endonuclease
VAGDAARPLDPAFPNLAPAVVAGYRNAPEAVVAEIIDGELSLTPRPRLRHARGATRLVGKLAGFDDPGEGGPGGWVLLIEPELHLGPRPDIAVPDLAGWRRERLPADFMEGAAATLAPDWCCEVLSASTEEIDRGRKLDFYRREGVAHVWLVSPTLRSVEVLRSHDLGWLLVATFRGDAVVHVQPFDALGLDLAGLWAPQRRSPPASEALAFFPRTALHIPVGRVSCALPPRRSPRCVRRRWGAGSPCFISACGGIVRDPRKRPRFWQPPGSLKIWRPQGPRRQPPRGPRGLAAGQRRTGRGREHLGERRRGGPLGRPLPSRVVYRAGLAHRRHADLPRPREGAGSRGNDRRRPRRTPREVGPLHRDRDLADSWV